MKLRQTRADLIRPADFCMTGFGNFIAKQTDRARQTGPAAALYCFSESSSPSYGVSLPKFDISIAERKPSVNKRAGKLPLTRRKDPCRRFSAHFRAVSRGRHRIISFSAQNISMQKDRGITAAACSGAPSPLHRFMYLFQFQYDDLSRFPAADPHFRPSSVFSGTL